MSPFFLAIAVRSLCSNLSWLPLSFRNKDTTIVKRYQNPLLAKSHHGSKEESPKTVKCQCCAAVALLLSGLAVYFAPLLLS